MKVNKYGNRHILNEVLLFYQFIYGIGNQNEALSDDQLIYILIWEDPHLSPMLDNNSGRQYFITQNCSFRNCFLTENRSLLSDIVLFDVILFHSVTLEKSRLTILPSNRSIDQKYILMSNEPAVMYPIPSHYNGFFNYTFTYKLNSDTTWRFFIVRNKNGEIVGPKRDVKWRNANDMEPISEETKRKLQTKNKAAAWFVSHCPTTSQRENFAQNLISDLKKYNLTVDVIGYCGNLYCKQWDEDCHVRIETDYYFYLAFENSMCEDYVTEKILTATKHFAVPIVYGGANYSRFMPDGSFLDADALGSEELARIMNDSIYNKEKYYDFFRWHRYYSFHVPSESSDSDETCALCAFLNDKKHEYARSVYTHITWFWI